MILPIVASIKKCEVSIKQRKQWQSAETIGIKNRRLLTRLQSRK